VASVLDRAKDEFAARVARAGLTDTSVNVTSRTLSTEEAICTPQYDDLPILRGKEVLIEAEFCGAKGHAFTNQPGNWAGSLGELLALPLTTNRGRAVLLAAMNAVMRYLGEVERTVHCRDEVMEQCGAEMAAVLRAEFGEIRVGLVGYQPGLVAGLVAEFGAKRVRVTDLALENIGRIVHGVEIRDGWNSTAELIADSELVLATGSTIANATYDQLAWLASSQGIPLILFGVTPAAVCHLCGIRRLCLRAT